MMSIFKRFPSEHGDFIHDVSFDFYGKRLASCSSDRKIKIWETDDDGEWKLQTEWTAHQGSVWKLTWAHPEFGQIIATCSFDRTVSIWEEQNAPYTPSSLADSWRNHAQLVDSRESIHDVQFAPRHLGLRLATGSADGFVRIYEAIDILNLSHWPLKEEFLADKDGATCLSWNGSRFDVPMILVGSNSPVAKVWAFNTTFNRWQVLVELIGHTDGVHDVSWAPNMGRSYHLLATASKDHILRIWKIKPSISEGESSGGYDVELLACHDHHHSQVWRVEWNVTGTMLASSGDDGTIRMWQSDYQGNWVCISTVCGELRPITP